MKCSYSKENFTLKSMHVINDSDKISYWLKDIILLLYIRFIKLITSNFILWTFLLSLQNALWFNFWLLLFLKNKISLYYSRISINHSSLNKVFVDSEGAIWRGKHIDKKCRIPVFIFKKFFFKSFILFNTLSSGV